MEIEKLKIIDKLGIHARPASMVVRKAKEFNSDVKFIFNNKEVNAKSIMSLMTLGVKSGDEFKIQINGENEKEVLKIIIDYLKEIELADRV